LSLALRAYSCGIDMSDRRCGCSKCSWRCPVYVSDIRIPVEIVVGRGDTVAPPATNAQHYAALISGAKLMLLPATVTHYTFVPACTDQGKQTLTRLCYDVPGLNRQRVQAQVGDLAAAFFQKSLSINLHGNHQP
jgi:predicted dienelactone hydrolase